jgi:uncharacterized repeat protein (TIGR03803 family)
LLAATPRQASLQRGNSFIEEHILKLIRILLSLLAIVTVPWALVSSGGRKTTLVRSIAVESGARTGTEKVLTEFNGSNGANPQAGLTFDSKGNLFGTTKQGGGIGGGAVFELSRVKGRWEERVLYSFTGGNDGSNPISSLVIDANGSLYGTTSEGGAHGAGTVFQLTPSGKGWVEHVLYSFTGGRDGSNPWAGVTFDKAGALYGTTEGGGRKGSAGTVFRLVRSGAAWGETTLYQFRFGHGMNPRAGVILDDAGNIYGTTEFSVFELQYTQGKWTETELSNFGGAELWGGQSATEKEIYSGRPMEQSSS